MPNITYGNRIIEYSIIEDPTLKSHYITVERQAGVVLKGKPLLPDQAEKLILKKASWILDKLDLVRRTEKVDIVTGSRIPYLGKQYYVEVLFGEDVQKPTVTFNHSQFKITANPNGEVQENIKDALEGFYRSKAVEKITPRVKQWSASLNLHYSKLRFRKMEKRWGSCTSDNIIILNYEAIKLPYTLIDYLIVHEMCHIVIKNHSKEFWALLAKHLPNWKQLDARMTGMKM